MFKEIDGYEGYFINECGIVKNKKGHIMRTAESNTGYLRTSLEIYDENGKLIRRDNKSIHRLVAKTFIENPENLPIVMHKDNDKLHNHVSNLKWGTAKENVEQAMNDGLHPAAKKYTNESLTSIAFNKAVPYVIYNDNERIICNSRYEVADTIGYELISLKNMVGNDRIISQGTYKGYKIRKANSPIKFKK